MIFIDRFDVKCHKRGLKDFIIFPEIRTGSWTGAYPLYSKQYLETFRKKCMFGWVQPTQKRTVEVIKINIPRNTGSYKNELHCWPMTFVRKILQLTQVFTFIYVVFGIIIIIPLYSGPKAKNHGGNVKISFCLH